MLRHVFVYGIVTLCDLTFQTVPLTCFLAISESYNPREAGTFLVWALPRSLATTGGITFCFLFLLVLRCFSSQGSLHDLVMMTVRQTAGLPHSDICGSKVICTSPQLFAAYHVLRRLPEPRHPPCALSYFRHTRTLFVSAHREFWWFPLGGFAAYTFSFL